MRIIGLIPNKHHGLKEPDVTGLIQAIIISRIIYTAQHLQLNISCREKFQTMPGRAYQQAVVLPPSAATGKRLSLGARNTVEENVEAHLTSQRKRLTPTPTSRRLGYCTNDGGRTAKTETLRVELRDKLNGAPVPLNLHPEHHTGRASARAKSIQSRIKIRQSPRFEIHGRSEVSESAAMAISVADPESPSPDSFRLHQKNQSGRGR